MDPNPLEVKASDKEEATFKVMADKDAALGENTINVSGTLSKGSPTSVAFKVEVVKP